MGRKATGMIYYQIDYPRVHPICLGYFFAPVVPLTRHLLLSVTIQCVRSRTLTVRTLRLSATSHSRVTHFLKCKMTEESDGFLSVVILLSLGSSMVQKSWTKKL